MRGHPSTWLTQLVERLLGHAEDPGWLGDTHTGLLAHPPRYNGHGADGDELPLRLSLWLSLTHPLRALSRLVASVLSGHGPPRWFQSAALSVSGTHINIHTQVVAAFRLGRRGACCPSTVISSSLPPAISVPSALSALPPLLVSSHMATTPPHPPCHPPDSFPMPNPPAGALPDSSKCTSLPQEQVLQLLLET